MSIENNRSINNQLDTYSTRLAQEKAEYKAFRERTDRGCGCVALTALTLTVCRLAIWIADSQANNETIETIKQIVDKTLH